jgi:hypothetical protein
MEDPDFVWLERANNAVEDAPVMEQNEVILLPGRVNHG